MALDISCHPALILVKVLPLPLRGAATIPDGPASEDLEAAAATLSLLGGRTAPEAPAAATLVRLLGGGGGMLGGTATITPDVRAAASTAEETLLLRGTNLSMGPEVAGGMVLRFRAPRGRPLDLPLPNKERIFFK